ncbi:MAG TPA: efflux RND transporter periplasmic adaptor subunit, partial [Bdellovibrionota bacterium]|nr:efflux RND transporter periplasmic adaptor subunit [Bdellovibrionota bacterium]
VIKGKGIFEPRAVTVGVKTKDHYEIISGLTEGEIVATAANFLIDSESRLRSVIKELTQPKDKP